MKRMFETKGSRFKVFIIFSCLSLFILNPPQPPFSKGGLGGFVAEAKVYIDIDSPVLKKLPIAIQEFSGISGKEISDIIRDDLTFTGLFLYIDRAAYI